MGKGVVKTVSEHTSVGTQSILHNSRHIMKVTPPHKTTCFLFPLSSHSFSHRSYSYATFVLAIYKILKDSYFFHIEYKSYTYTDSSISPLQFLGPILFPSSILFSLKFLTLIWNLLSVVLSLMNASRDLLSNLIPRPTFK